MAANEKKSASRKM